MRDLRCLDELIELVEKRIRPYTLNESGHVTMSNLLRKYPFELLVECVDISYEHYIKRDEEGELIKESVEVFLSKIGGVAYNQSRTPIEKAISHVMNTGKKNYSYWNQRKGKELLEDYVELLRYWGWNEEAILSDIEGKLMRETKRARCWSQWRSMMEALVGEHNEEE